MRGWVYVISNKAMPGIVKVGFTLKDPELRAQELDNTGTPHQYIVEYEVLVEDPEGIEHRTHKELARIREGKEWFRCRPEDAVAAIKHVVGDEAIAESYKRVERQKAEALLARRMQEQEERERQSENEARFREHERVINEKYGRIISAAFPSGFDRIFRIWLLCSGVPLLAYWIWRGRDPEDFVAISCAVLGAFLTPVVKGYFDARREQSPKYRAIIQQRDAELRSARKVFEDVNRK